MTEGVLYRRGNFNGTMDQVILDALMRREERRDRLLARVSAGGPRLLPGETIRYEDLLDQTAITYPYATVNELTGETIKTILEDVADNCSIPIRITSRAGDMVRVGGMRYAIDPSATMGKRITRMELGGKPIEAARKYKVAGGRRCPTRRARRAASPSGTSWRAISRRGRRSQPRELELPALQGVAGNPGLA